MGKKRLLVAEERMNNYIKRFILKSFYPNYKIGPRHPLIFIRLLQFFSLNMWLPLHYIIYG